MKEYRVEIYHKSSLSSEYTYAGENMRFAREILSRYDWENIVLALRAALCNGGMCVTALIFVDDHYHMLVSLWRAAANHNLLHLDMVRGGKYLEIRRFKEVQKDA